MSEFEIGSVSTVNSHCVEIAVFETGVPQLNSGSKELMERICFACGIESQVRSWNIVPIRSFFFGGFRQSECWEDRWRKGWSVVIEFGEKIEQKSDVVFAPAEPLDAQDPTWAYGMKIPEDKRVICTIIGRKCKLTPFKSIDDIKNTIPNRIKESKDFQISSISQYKGIIFLSLIFKSHVSPEKCEKYLSNISKIGYITYWEELL